MQERISPLIEVFVFAISFILYVGCSSNKQVDGADSQLVQTGLYVDGTTLRRADGSPFVMRGINHGHNWFPDQEKTAFDTIAASGANTIRIVLSYGQRWKKDAKASLRKVIDAATSRGMIPVIEVHDGTGSDDIEVLTRIAEYWCEMADVLAGTENYCILNIANEWCGGWKSKVWRDGYTKVIPMIRQAGIKNTIMVDAAGWGQFGYSIRKYGAQVFNSDPLKNTMFSVHMYGMSGRFNWLIRFNLEGATKQNLCVCAGEFGWKHSDGDVKEEYLMQYCQEKGIGWLAWSWKGNSGGVEYLDMTSEWDGSKLSDWGDKVINGEFGIKKTSNKVKIN
jgi:mannan endo-1,4-beta-mannosidase